MKLITLNCGVHIWHPNTETSQPNCPVCRKTWVSMLIQFLPPGEEGDKKKDA